MLAECRFLVALVDDDSGFRDALQWLLTSSGYEVCCFGDAASFVEGHDLSALGCSLIDLRLGNDNGIEALTASRRRGYDAPVIMISAYGDIPTAVRAVQLGAFGFIEKPIDNEKLLDVVATACRRHVEIRQQHGRAVDALRKFSRLTDREADVYWLLVGGAATKEIAGKLEISTRTAETHRGRVFDKFEARGLDDIVQAAFHLRPLIDPVSGA
ncbi:MAG: response regulator transcription factor [Magnetospirillum sp.]|nr:MAG: response regulator transcription factor [Magnetospirillum sp.]